MYTVYMVGTNTELEVEQVLSINVKNITPFYDYSLEALNDIFKELFLRDILGVKEFVNKVTFKLWTFREPDEN